MSILQEKFLSQWYLAKMSYSACPCYFFKISLIFTSEAPRVRLLAPLTNIGFG